jgi:hypothetical protein
MRRHIATGGALVLVALLLSVTSGQAQAGPARQSGELLTNPSFEQPFVPDWRSDGGGFVAHGWTAWWVNTETDDLQGPEYKQANINVDPNRVRSGQDAQQYFRPWTRHLAGFYQRVEVPANSQLRFTIFGHAWSTFCKETEGGDLDCDARNSYYGNVNPIAMKVGIDPAGGTDPFGGAVVWSPERGVYDNFDQFAVEATAQGDRVTVFVYSNPEWPAPVINVYWDDASLIAIGEGSGSPPPGDDTPEATSPPAGGGAPAGGGIGSIPTQAVQPDGSLVHVVQAGETLGGIAVAYGVEVQTIRDLNSLTTDVIQVGQRLVIKTASEAGAATPVPTAGTPEPTEEATEEPEATPTPIESAEVTDEAGAICLTLFEDSDSDALRGADENLLASGVLSIAGPLSDSHTTDGLNEPHCFSELPAGDYMVTISPPSGYHLTGLAEVPVTLSGSGEIYLSFGAAPDTGAEAGEAGAEEPVAASPVRTILTVVGIGAGVVLLVGIGAVVFMAIRRRRAAVS